MIVSPQEYAKMFPSNGCILSAKTIKRRCEKGNLPTNHIPRFLSNVWVIEIAEMPPSMKNMEVTIKPKRKLDMY